MIKLTEIDRDRVLPKKQKIKGIDPYSSTDMAESVRNCVIEEIEHLGIKFNIEELETDIISWMGGSISNCKRLAKLISQNPKILKLVRGKQGGEI